MWFAKYRLPDGRQTTTKIGPAWPERGRPPAGYYTRKTAQAALDALLTDARRGTLAGQHRSGKVFADATAEWLRYVETEKGCATTTLRGYKSAVDKHLLEEFGKDTPLEKITRAQVDAYRERLLEEGVLSRRTIQSLLIAMFAVMKRAKRRGWITSNPCEDAERVSVRASGEFNVLEPVQVEAVAREAATTQDAAIIRAAAYAGLRLGELRALRRRDVDFTGRTIHVRRNLPGVGKEKTPKGGLVRSVPLLDQVAAVLDGLSRREHFTQTDDRVFVNAVGGAVDGADMRGAFYDALTAAKLGHLREQDDPIIFHDLRHTFGTLAVQAWELPKVQAYMGHADIKTTMIYVHHRSKTDDADSLAAVVAAQLAAATSSSHDSRLFAGSGRT